MASFSPGFHTSFAVRRVPGGGQKGTKMLDAVSTGHSSTLHEVICLLVTLRHVKLLIAASQLGIL